MVVEIPPLKISLLALILTLGIPAFAQANEAFIRKCESELTADEKKWFQLRFNNSDCRILSNKISELKSFEEVLPPLSLRSSFVNDLEEIKNISDDKLSNDILEDKRKKYHLFEGLDLFRGFENLKHIALPDRKYTSVCDVLEKFPQLEKLTIETKDFYAPETDGCLQESENIQGIYLRGSLHVSGQPAQNFLKTKTKVLGVEYWNLAFSYLRNYPYARFLHFTNAPSVVGIEILGSNIRLQTIVIDSTSFPDLSGLSVLKELRSLTITNSRITDISFISRLRWLERVSFPKNQISDLRPLEDLKHLKYADVSSNRVRILPKLKLMKSLFVLNVSDNKLVSVGELGDSVTLEQLDLSKNAITDFSPLEGMSNLRALNISANAPLKVLTLPPMPRLKVLAIDGSSGKSLGGSFTAESSIITERILSESAKRYLQYIKGRYTESCDTSPSFYELSPLIGFDELEVLSLKDQKLNSIPDLTSLKRLRFLNLKGNSLSKIETEEIPELKYINVTENPIIDLHQKIPGQARLYSEQLMTNFKCQVIRRL